MANILICDGSRYQSFQPNGTYLPLDFQKMKQAGAGGYFGRVSLGNFYTDPAFQMNFDAGTGILPQGAYLAVYPQYSSASHIAKLKEGLAGRKPDFPIVVDCEKAEGQFFSTISKVISEVCDRVADFDGRIPFIYTRQSWWDWYVQAGNWSKYPLMAARYNGSLSGPWSDGRFKFRDWYDWACWQFSADGNLRGAEFGAYSNSIDLSWLKPQYLPHEAPVEQAWDVAITEWARTMGYGGPNP